MADGQTHPGPMGSPLASAPRDQAATGTIGLLVDGRYRLRQRRTGDATSSTWEGRDDHLHRAVHVRVVAGSTAADAVDAARRAAAVEDSRLARVLDVGTETAADGSALGWVVSEQPPGRLLADLLRESPLAPARVRALVGEAAAVLARASAAGLHHRRLDPACVALSPEGAVTVLGLEVAAAAAGLPPVLPAQAEREDAVGLVSLLYAGLTGLWPTGPSAGLRAAPLTGGLPVPPADLVTGVPNDLDTLAAVTLGHHDDGPRSPAELVDELAPWGSTSGPVTSSRRALPRSSTRSTPRGDAPQATPQTAPQAPPPTAASTAPPSRHAPTRPVVTPPAGAVPADRSTGTPSTPAAPAAAAAAAAGPPTAALPASGEGGLDAFDALVGRAGRGRRRAADPPAPPATGPLASGALAATWDEEPPLRRGAGRLVLAGVALALVVLGVVAWVNLPRVSGALGFDTSSATTPPPATGSPAAGSPTSSSAPPAAGPPLGVAAVRALDPLGDDTENDDEAGRAADGDPASAWSSSTYRTAALGGLKPGVGLALDLGADARVSSVDLSVAGTGGTVEVRSSPTGDFDGSTVLATATVGSGSDAPVVVRLPEPVTTRWVVLWFTALPPADGGFRAEVSEVAVH